MPEDLQEVTLQHGQLCTMRARDGIMLPVLTQRQAMGTSDLEVIDRYLCGRSRTRYFRRWMVGYPLTVGCIWLRFKTAAPVLVDGWVSSDCWRHLALIQESNACVLAAF